MAIVSSSQQGIRISSSAANGTLGSQVAAANNQIIIPSSLAASNNGDLANTLEAGRLIMIRKGTATEEIRYCVSNIGTTLTLHEEWTQPPITGDTYDISYILQDAATTVGLSLIVKRVQDYSSNRRFRVLSGGWIAFLNGVSLETHNTADAVTSVFSVETGGYFDSGYLASGFPVSGSTIISTADTTGDFGCEFTTGSSCRLYDLVINSVQQNKLTINGNVTTDSLKLYNIIFQTDFTGSLTEFVNIKNATIEGKRALTDTITLNSFSKIEDIVLISTNGFVSNDNTIVETIEVRNAVILSNNTRYVLVNDNKTWKFVNPQWTVDTTTQNNIAFENGTNNSVQELFNFRIGVQRTSSEAIPSAKIYLYEGLTTQSIVDITLSSAQLDRGSLISNGTGYTVDDVLLLSGGTFTSQASIIVTSIGGAGEITGFNIFNPGVYSVFATEPALLTGGSGTGATFDGFYTSILTDTDVITRTFTDNAGTSLTSTPSGDYALKVYEYGFVPFVSSVTFESALEQRVVLATDTNVTVPSATALTAGTGINYVKHGLGETDTRPMKVLHYDLGTGTAPTTGETITQGTATGTLVEFLGDPAEGILVLENWNGVEFANNQIITGATFSATTDLSGDIQSFYEEYTYEVDASSLPMSTVYNYLAARMSENPITLAYENIIIWGESEQSQLVYSGSNGYFTERNSANQEGVWVSNRGTGNIDYFTSDSGAQYNPPLTISFALTGLQPNTEVRIYRSSDREELAGTENSGTSFVYNYLYTGIDETVYAVIFHIEFKDIRLVNLTLSNINQSIPIQQQTDRVYRNV